MQKSYRQIQVCPVRFAKIWLMLLFMLIYCERKKNISSLKSTVEVVLKNMMPM
jgi:hypothetical protein